jgi:hypothetical protein
MAGKAAPKGLGGSGRALWRRVSNVYDLREDELATLEDACRITDMIAALEDAWDDQGKPMTTTGSMGQLIIHPLIGEIRVQRMARNALFRQLKLPDQFSGSRPNQQRQAAQTRWSSAHGRSA